MMASPDRRAGNETAPRRVRGLLCLALAGALLVPEARARDEARYDLSCVSDAEPAPAGARRKTAADGLGLRLAERLRVMHADRGCARVGPHRDKRPGLQPPPAAKTKEKTRRQDLERSLDEYVKLLRRQGRLAADERTAWSVYDFTTGEKLVEINADIKLQAASLIKPFVVLAFMDRVAAGKLDYDAPSRVRLERMIQHSDNSATNWAMRRLGGPAAVRSLLRKRYGNILQDVELVEYIPKGGRTYRNKASARDYSRFLLALWKDQLPGSAEMKRLLALPKRDRLLTGTDLPDDTESFSKTGSTRHLCGDMGVLQVKGPDGRPYAYAVIGIIEKRRAARNYLRWLRARGDVIREISGMVYRLVGSLHGFAAGR